VTLFENNVSKAYILTVFEMIFWNCRENIELNESKWCILTIFLNADFYVKEMKLGGAF